MIDSIFEPEAQAPAMPVVKKVVGFDTEQEFHEVDGSEAGRIATEPCAPAVASGMDARMV